jgi:SNF2 family DNA or RNA helicase
LILEPYQLVPLQRIENLPFPRILLADDTGLGKTTEAGLILFPYYKRGVPTASWSSAARGRSPSAGRMN